MLLSQLDRKGINYENGFFPLLISFHPAPDADPQAGHRANTAHFARHFFRLPFPLLFRLHLRSLLATYPERMRGLVKIVQLSSTPLPSTMPKILLRSLFLLLV